MEKFTKEELEILKNKLGTADIQIEELEAFIKDLVKYTDDLELEENVSKELEHTENIDYEGFLVEIMNKIMHRIPEDDMIDFCQLADYEYIYLGYDKEISSQYPELCYYLFKKLNNNDF